MQIEIHRRKLRGLPLDDGRVAMSYDVLVPAAECPPGATGGTVRVHADGEYRAFPEATWAPDVATGWARYVAWLDHQWACEQLMLDWLHQHCPETAHLQTYPLLWRDVEAAAGPGRIAFEWRGNVSRKVIEAVRSRYESGRAYEAWRDRTRAAAQAPGGRSERAA